MLLTIAYFTNRKNPRFQWFVDSLAAQIPLEERDQVQLIFVDALAWEDDDFTRLKGVDAVDLHLCVSPQRATLLSHTGVHDRFPNVIHIPPKPCVWQGPFRLTSRDWFAASNARNTALIFAAGGYFVGVDDLSVLSPGWMDQVRHAAANGYCVCGSYKKVKDLVVENGEIRSFTEHPSGVDSRWNRGSGVGIVPWTGSGLYGCSFGLPLELALDVDGFDQICDGAGAEDYDFGIRVERAGGRFYYNRNMLTLESEEAHYEDEAWPRRSKIVNADRLPPGYDRNPMSDHVLLHRVTTEQRVTCLRGPSLRVSRIGLDLDGTVAVPQEPTTDWRDGTPLSAY